MMKRSQSASRADASPAKRVAGFIARLDPSVARLARSSRTALRKRFPTAVELVYDNYNALAMGWGPNERASEIMVSHFTRGATLPDPRKLLKGSGNRGRHIRLESVSARQRPRRRPSS
jgi:hypothetical protein